MLVHGLIMKDKENYSIHLPINLYMKVHFIITSNMAKEFLIFKDIDNMLVNGNIIIQMVKALCISTQSHHHHHHHLHGFLPFRDYLENGSGAIY